MHQPESCPEPSKRRIAGPAEHTDAGGGGVLQFRATTVGPLVVMGTMAPKPVLARIAGGGIASNRHSASKVAPNPFEMF